MVIKQKQVDFKTYLNNLETLYKHYNTIFKVDYQPKIKELSGLTIKEIKDLTMKLYVMKVKENETTESFNKKILNLKNIKDLLSGEREEDFKRILGEKKKSCRYGDSRSVEMMFCEICLINPLFEEHYAIKKIEHFFNSKGFKVIEVYQDNEQGVLIENTNKVLDNPDFKALVEYKERQYTVYIEVSKSLSDKDYSSPALMLRETKVSSLKEFSSDKHVYYLNVYYNTKSIDLKYAMFRMIEPMFDKIEKFEKVEGKKNDYFTYKKNNKWNKGVYHFDSQKLSKFIYKV